MKLNVIMMDTYRAQIAIQCEGQSLPYGRRLVQIELTPEQVTILAAQRLGTNCGQQVFETIGDVWLEH